MLHLFSKEFSESAEKDNSIHLISFLPLNMKHSVAYFFIFSTFLSGFIYSEYTPQNLFELCFYIEEHGVILVCHGLTDDDIEDETIFLYVDLVFQTFNISNSVLSFIPSNPEIFQNVKTIYITQSSLTFLFAGVPPSKMETIIMDEVEFQYGMSWEYFEDLHNLKNIIIRNVNIVSLDTEFERSASNRLVTLMLQNTNTSFMSENAFGKFTYLSDLRIESCSIKRLRRNMFPRPAEFLKTLSFEDNKISYLPKDLFAEMPSLKIVDFSFNYIKEISVSLLRIIKDLNYLTFEGNPLNCNCNMQWILWKNITWEETFNRQLEGVCKSPPNVTGVELQALTPEDFAHCPSNSFLRVWKKVATIHVNQMQRLQKLKQISNF